MEKGSGHNVSLAEELLAVDRRVSQFSLRVIPSESTMVQREVTHLGIYEQNNWTCES